MILVVNKARKQLKYLLYSILFLLVHNKSTIFYLFRARYVFHNLMTRRKNRVILTRNVRNICHPFFTLLSPIIIELGTYLI